MIVGLGCDLVSIERMRLKFSERLANKVLTRKELVGYDAVEDKARYLAKAWAVKEATYKALHDKELDMLKSVEYISPYVFVAGYDNMKFHVSVSDDNGFAMATVVAEQQGDGVWDKAF